MEPVWPMRRPFTAKMGDEDFDEQFDSALVDVRIPELIHPSMSVDELLLQLSNPVAAYHTTGFLKHVGPKSALVRRIATNFKWQEEEPFLWAQESEELYDVAQKLGVTGVNALPYIKEADWCVTWRPDSLDALLMAAFLVCQENFGDNTLPAKLAIQLWKMLFEPRFEDGLGQKWCSFYEQNFGLDKPVTERVWNWIRVAVVGHLDASCWAPAPVSDVPHDRFYKAFAPVLSLA